MYMYMYCTYAHIYMHVYTKEHFLAEVRAILQGQCGKNVVTQFVVEYLNVHLVVYTL